MPRNWRNFPSSKDPNYDRQNGPEYYPPNALPQVHHPEFGPGGAISRPLTILKRNEAKAFALSIVESADYRESVKARAASGTLPPPIEQMLWYYAYGKPAETLQIVDPPGRDELAGLSDEQLAERATAILDLIQARRRATESEATETSTPVM